MTFAPRFFLRDAVAILPGNRRDLAARLERSCGLARELDLDLEITLDARFFRDGQDELLAAIARQAGAFRRTLFHLHSGPDLPLGDNAPTRQLVDYCRKLIAAGRLHGVCVHPDLVADFAFLQPLHGPECYLAAEVLDEKCTSHNTLAEIRDLLERHQWLGLVLDTAHIAGMLPAGEPDLAAYCAAFASRVVEVHISQMGNHYDPAQMGPDFATNHSLLVLGERPLAANLEPLRTLDPLHQKGRVNLVIEGVIPAGEYGRLLLADEARSFREFFR